MKRIFRTQNSSHFVGHNPQPIERYKEQGSDDQR
jgi:hypothetical protein